MNFASALARFSTGTYTVTRRAPAVVDGFGRAQAQAGSTFTIRASVQPFSGQDLQRLPEGYRVGERKKLYTATPLRADRMPDVVTIGGADYEVEVVQDWVGFGGDFYKAIVLRVGN